MDIIKGNGQDQYFRNFIKKIVVLKQTKNLKESDVLIEEDYTKEIQEERRNLLPKLKVRAKGLKAILKYNKLIVNDEIYETKSNEQIYNEEKEENKHHNRKQ